MARKKVIRSQFGPRPGRREMAYHLQTLILHSSFPWVQGSVEPQAVEKDMSMLPKLEKHLAMAKKIQDKVGK
jgi:hypothetical protein